MENFKKSFELSWFLAVAGFKTKNEGSYLGIFWYLLAPLLLFLIMLFVKGAAFSQTSIKFYPIYLLFGVIVSNLFSNVIGASINAMSGNAGFIKSMKIDYEPLILSNILQNVFSHMFEVAVIIGFMVFYKISLLGLVYYFIILLFFLVFLAGASFLFATIGAYISDFSNVWRFASQLIFFITPTFYAISPGDPHYFVNLFNPLFYFLTIFRDVVVYEKMPQLWMILAAISIAFGFLAVGLFVFKKFKNKFAELV